MRILSIDISGRVVRYDDALYEAMVKECSKDDLLICGTPYKIRTTPQLKFSLWNFIPKEIAGSPSKFKKMLKALEVFLNYIKLAFIISKYKPDILHLQWLPFLEICRIECIFLYFYKLLNKKLRIVLTVHNIYPHNFSEKKKQKYRKRFIGIKSLLDRFIVHTKSSVEELEKEFGIKKDTVNVIKHGVFIPTNIPKKNKKEDDKCVILIYGGQSYYKGTDIFIDAINKLPVNYKKIVDVRIIGKTSNELVSLLEKSANIIYWNNSFILDEELNQEIVNADLLVYPYRQISQSGALLLGLFFEKPIIASNLPSFIETLENYPSDLFFISEDSDSLMNSIIYFLSMENSSKKNLLSILKGIKINNSWQASAKQTLELYKKLV